MSTGAAVREMSRDQILVDGFLRHREHGTLVNRWRHRYVVFKISTSGKLTFTIYKDKPPTPSNELHEIPIEEYGGVDTNLKIDGEKNAFAILLTHSTECFTTDSPDELHKWTRTLHEYLGKELVLSVTVPYKQNVLKQGRAFIRIRNTGFTISTAETPPRCQGSWQILHVRKFGGSKSFRFETGSKCPLGEAKYELETDELEKMKSVFTDLSMHKPIFNDDRMGRRMTQEHSRLTQIREQMQTSATPTTCPQAGHRRSLQWRGQKYENFSSRAPFDRRTSVQHENRQRSNAILLQETQSDPSFQTLPLPHKKKTFTESDGHYYNFEQFGAVAPPPFKRAGSDPPQDQHIYYNHTTFEATPTHSLRRRDSCDDSDEDDFVDMQNIVSDHAHYVNGALYANSLVLQSNDHAHHNGHCYAPDDSVLYANGHAHQSNSHHAPKSDSVYYNVTVASNSEAAPGGPTHQLSYENITPTHSLKNKSLNQQCKEKKEEVLEENVERQPHMYTNLPIRDEHKTSSSNESVHSDSALPHSESRIQKSKNSFHSSIDIATAAAASTTSRPPQARKRLNSSSSFPNLCDIIKGGERRESGEEGKEANNKSNSTDEIHAKPPRPQVYDRLEPAGSNQGSSEKLKFSPPEERKLPVKAPPQPPPPPKTVWTRRPHMYEDVDLDDEENDSGHAPPTSGGEEAPSQRINPYKRKVSVIGHEHSYEYVKVQSVAKQQQESQPHPPSVSSPVRKVPSPSRSVSPRGAPPTMLKSRPPLPLQKEVEPDSQTTPTKDSNKIVGSAESQTKDSPLLHKKPIPTPRRISEQSLKKPRHGSDKEMVDLSGRASKSPAHRPQSSKKGSVHSSLPAHSKVETPPTQAPSRPPKPDWIKNESQATPASSQAKPPAPPVNTYRSKILQGLHVHHSSPEILQGLPHSSPEKTQKPALPPKKPREDWGVVQGVGANDTNYTMVLPKEKALKPDEIGTGTYKIRRVIQNDISVNYSDVDHFLTQQIQELKEERQLEKGLAH